MTQQRDVGLPIATRGRATGTHDDLTLKRKPHKGAIAGWRIALAAVALASCALAIQTPAEASVARPTGSAAPCHRTHVGNAPNLLCFSSPRTAIPPVTGQSAGAPINEPHLLINRHGIFLSASYQGYNCATGAVSSHVSSCVWASTDGRTFHIKGGDVQGTMGANTTLAEARSGALLLAAKANLGLGDGIGGISLSRSTDHGTSWTESIHKQGLTDRPWLMATDNDVVMTFSVVPGGVFGVRSADGGRTFGAPYPIVAGSIYVNGQGLVDPVRAQLLSPYAAASEPACTAGFNGCFDVLEAARSSDAGKTWVGERVVSIGGRQGTTGPALASSDADGNEYLVYGTAKASLAGQTAVGPAHIWVTVQRMGRQGWSKPVQIDPSDGSAMMPSVTAAGHGRLAVVYYASRRTDAENHSAVWDTELALSSDGGRTFARQTLAKAAYTGAGNNRVPLLLDSIDIAQDSSGRLIAAWTDTRGSDGSRSSIDFATQMGGPPLSQYPPRIASMLDAGMGTAPATLTSSARTSLASSGLPRRAVLAGLILTVGGLLLSRGRPPSVPKQPPLMAHAR